MTFAARMTRSPDAFDPKIGAEVAEGFGDFPAEIRGLIAGTAGCSPYLAGLLGKEAPWLKTVLDDPEAALLAVRDDLGEVPLDTLPVALRQAKRRSALLIALADLGGVFTLEQVTEHLSLLADVSVDVAMKRLVAAEIARGKLPALVEEDVETAGGDGQPCHGQGRRVRAELFK